MLLALFVAMLLSPFRPCQGSPTFQEEYRGDYMPKSFQSWHGLQVVAPDTPYVAVAGTNLLYFIDTRLDTDTAKHIKQQIERAFTSEPDEYISIDIFAATAEVKNRVTSETVFVFDPPFARVLFAKGINKRNPELKLPEHKPAGDWVVAYDLGTTLTKRVTCSDSGSSSNTECKRQINDAYGLCHDCRVDDLCDLGMQNSIGSCQRICARPVDTPKEDGETDASYYQRMDKLHWEKETVADAESGTTD